MLRGDWHGCELLLHCGLGKAHDTQIARSLLHLRLATHPVGVLYSPQLEAQDSSMIAPRASGCFVKKATVLGS